MEQKIIEAEKRTGTGKNASRRMRRAGRVPGTLYGAGGEALSLTLNPKQLLAMLRSEAGQNTIFNLNVQGGERSPAMIVESQFEPVQGQLLHVDLKRIAMGEKLKVFVPLVPVGDAKGVKMQGGTLEFVLREVEVECLPADITEHFSVAVQELAIGEYIRVADLQKGVGEKIQLLSDPNGVVCHVVAPKVEEAVAAAEEAVEVPAEPELIKKGKAAEEGEEETESREKRKKKE